MAGVRKIIGVGVILLALAVSILYLAVSQSPEAHSRLKRFASSEAVKAEETKFTFADIFGGKFSYQSTTTQWISGTEYIWSDSNHNIFIRDAATDIDYSKMNGYYYEHYNASSYKVSSTQEFVLLLTNYKKGWRHSYNGTYVVYDIENQMIREDITFPDNVQYITWSPVGNALAYVYDFDIYYRPDVNDSAETRVTDTGRANFVYNGIPDWVYEEEMISSNNVMYFSPDGSNIAYAQFNDTDCDHIQFVRYEGTQYPQLIDVSYPKAGTTQPTNKVFIYDVANKVEQEIIPPADLAANDYLFSRVVWADESRAAVLWCDRLQTWSVQHTCDNNGTGMWNCSRLSHQDHKTSTGWLYQRRPYWIPVFGANTNEFFKVLPNNGWQHLALVNENNVTYLTSGEYTVTSVSASYPAIDLYEPVSDYVYFLATLEDPGKRQVYRVAGHQSSAPMCVTCKLATQFPGRCDYVTASFSTDGSYAVVRCRGESAPVDLQYRVDHAAMDADNILVNETMLNNNRPLVEAIASTQMSQVQHGKMTSTNTNYEFYYEQWNPPNFDENKRYPLLIDVYAGPGYQNVDYVWTRSWAPAYVPVGLEAIVVRVDGRGSNFYGDQFMHEVYRALGQKEIDDQVEAASYFGNLPYVDETRIAIWGWSYGGFATSHAMGLGTKTLKCGMAVAPLVDWRYYDTIYAERYMGLPSLNVEGYDKASVVNKAANFPQSSFYLIHGMADDNVHFQNAAQLEKELVKQDITFNDFFYADQDHSINKGNAFRHVYQILTKQLCECFGIPVPADVWY